MKAEGEVGCNPAVGAIEEEKKERKENGGRKEMKRKWSNGWKWKLNWSQVSHHAFVMVINQQVGREPMPLVLDVGSSITSASLVCLNLLWSSLGFESYITCHSSALSPLEIPFGVSLSSKMHKESAVILLGDRFFFCKRALTFGSSGYGSIMINNKHSFSNAHFVDLSRASPFGRWLAGRYQPPRCLFIYFWSLGVSETH